MCCQSFQNELIIESMNSMNSMNEVVNDESSYEHIWIVSGHSICVSYNQNEHYGQNYNLIFKL